ncbi:hypothetical protein FRC98_15850 [Lujinxingia vulgaris]|uniref:Cytochrome oxidase subunit I profile domain-containing protein n=1 Tax=Lujinxingia vulgaris TaxID=2600176 RepID=A0A5C6XC42_9DELT|nr:hypothetical protein [Lujinxingia vulgaris]TXD35678.1 hypothetical protein FRC98_15850 [Lujinxingia vulgaris]
MTRTSTHSPNLAAPRRLFMASALGFVVAAALGALFRFGMLRGDFFGLQAGDLRHAHSHLMLMGWATPALIALITARAPALGLKLPLRATLATGWAALALAALSTPAFALYGYRSAAIGDANIPIAAALSGVAMLVWYAFAALVAIAARRAPDAHAPNPARSLLKIAVGAMVISSVGAWALAAQMITKSGDALSQQLAVHFFVDLFGIGWLLVGALALLRAEIARHPSPTETRARWMLLAGLPLLFLAGMPSAELGPALRILGHVGAALSAAGFVALSLPLWRVLGAWRRVALGFLLASALMLASIAIPPVAHWGQTAGLRLFFLHTAFAGAVTLTLISVAARQFGPSRSPSPATWTLAVALLLSTLLPLTGIWPAALSGRWVLVSALAGALGATILSALATLQALLPRTAPSPTPSQAPRQQ